MKTLPTYFISHGGGPWPWLKEQQPFYAALARSLQQIPQEIGIKPRAILMISGHWESESFEVMSHPKPPMVYDYGGFPEHTYRISYPAPGFPTLAAKVHAQIQAAGLPSRLNPDRGFDHGTFSPMVVMYPEADVPVVQISIASHYDPSTHLKLGRALAPFRKENIVIIGSGFSYHNLQQFFNIEAARGPSKQFDDWLNETLVSTDFARRKERLLAWSDAPGARLSHPQEDHLVPLFVAVGAAQNEPANCIYHEDNFMGGISVSSFRFG